MKESPILIEKTFDTNTKKVWEAITKKELMKQWYFDLSDFKPEVGFTFTFTGGHEDGIQYIHECEIKEVISERKLTYSWLYKGYEGKSHVSFQLTPSGNKTTLTLTHSGIHTFPKTNPDFAINNFKEGWNYLINESLKAFLEKAH
jgi:uncharacterized protein YndB with AHSA1/START domain